ncbi:MAG: hypothetical protein IJM09_00535, partial [Neisseriaceae bacterium]|nr:hypothetical protein [Neisseriaceae bacterium]
IEIKAPYGTNPKWAGRWLVTQYDGEDPIDFNAVQGLTADIMTQDTEIEFRIIPFLDTCMVESGSWNLGSVTTNTKKTNCGTIVLPSGFEFGDISFDFTLSLVNKTQQVLRHHFQHNFDEKLMVRALLFGSEVMIATTVLCTGHDLSFSDECSAKADFKAADFTWEVSCPE